MALPPLQLCGARRTKRGGATCTRPAGEGTDHLGYRQCRLHGGQLPKIRRLAIEDAVTAQIQRQPAPFGGTVEPVTVAEVLMRELATAAAMSLWLHDTLAHWHVPDKLDLETGLPPMQQHVRGAGGGTNVYPSEYAVWLREYAWWSAESSRKAKQCADLGLEVRKIEAVQNLAAAAVAMARAMAASLGVEPSDARFHGLIADALEAARSAA